MDNRDFLDKLFDRGHKLASEVGGYVEGSERVIADKSSKLLDKVLKRGSAVIEKNNQVQGGGSRTFGGFPKFNLFDKLMPRNPWTLLSIPATSVVLFWGIYQLQVNPVLGDDECKSVLVFGDMRDPIIRGQVMDLYRRGLTLFICLENAGTYKVHNDEDDFLNYIDPKSASDWSKFSEFFKKHPKHELSSILFIPKLSYYPTGVVNLDQLESEIHSNVLLYYSTLIGILPHLPQNLDTYKIPLLIYNPSLSVNMKNREHHVESFVSGLINTVFQEFKSSNILNAYMVHIGLLQLGGQLSNYKYLEKNGSNIYNELYWPIYRLIMMSGGNFLQRFYVSCITLFGLYKSMHLGKLSLLFSMPFASNVRNILNYIIS
ncbi:UPF0744 protein YSC83 [Nakaseomyces bracarensis]|uniref:UPF0744 protein YSC83 n=1 Tax=Nakaseomyces bracarensis TaxID=273131 RepID=A0ABR4NQ29_9SACH